MLFACCSHIVRMLIVRDRSKGDQAIINVRSISLSFRYKDKGDKWDIS